MGIYILSSSLLKVLSPSRFHIKSTTALLEFIYDGFLLQRFSPTNLVGEKCCVTTQITAVEETTRPLMLHHITDDL